MIQRPIPRFSSLWTCILLLFCTACNDSTKDMPVPSDKMVRIISDIHVAEYYSQGLGMPSAFKKNPDSLSLYYNSILHHHQISYDSFMNAYRWLMKHPVIMDSIYNQVLSNLEQLRKEYPNNTGKPGARNPEDDPSKTRDTAAGNNATNIQEAGEI